MKKRIVIAMVTGMVIASLAGCGTQADATSQSPESSSAVESEAGTEDSVADESTSEGVIEENTDESSESVGAENESIVLYDEVGSFPILEALKDMTYEPGTGTITATGDIVFYDGDGFEVGYIKNGATISVSEFGLNAIARFENPIEGTDYDYLYVMKQYIVEGTTITLADAEEAIKREILRRDFDAPTYTSVTDDMELYEFRIPSVYRDIESEGPDFEVSKWFMKRDDNLEEGEDGIRFYKTYAIVCTEDTDGYIICQLYYKDKITDEELGISVFGR